MRSSIILLSIVSATLMGCGKNVERSAEPTTLSNGQISNLNGSSGARSVTTTDQCPDPLTDFNYPIIERFSDLGQDAASYKFESFQAVGVMTLDRTEAGQGAGSSVVSASIVNGVKKYKQECKDFRQIPGVEMNWSVEVPASMSGTGALSNSIIFSQQIGENRRESGQFQEGNLASCASADVLMSDAQGCGSATFYNLGNNEIGVLRVASIRSTSGSVISSKVFARYILSGGRTETPAPKPSSRPKPIEKKKARKMPHHSHQEPHQGQTVHHQPGTTVDGVMYVEGYDSMDSYMRATSTTRRTVIVERPVVTTVRRVIVTTPTVVTTRSIVTTPSVVTAVAASASGSNAIVISAPTGQDSATVVTNQSVSERGIVTQNAISVVGDKKVSVKSKNPASVVTQNGTTITTDSKLKVKIR